MVRTLCLCLLIVSNWPLWAASQLSASVDKNPAMVGEAIVLEVIADARLSADQLNFRILEQDFRVTVPSVSQNTRVINGEASHTTSWRVSLFAREPGQYTIPAFQVGQAQSQPIELEVLAASAAGDGKSDVFLTASLEQSQLHVQQTGYYRVTIHYRGDLQRGSLTEPSMEGATVQQIGRDEEGSVLVDGVRYRTISRRFAITPQRSGQFSITAPEFTGELLDRDSSRSNFFARTRTVLQHAEAIEVDVLSIPTDFPGDWLIAGLVTLHEEWSGDLTTLRQGEPITRTITLSGVDVAAHQLPDIDFTAPAGFRLYPQQPERQGAQRNGRLVAQKTFTLAMIPTDAGEVQLPELRLPWWNSQRQMLDYATLPARSIQVLPAVTAEADTTAPELLTSGQTLATDLYPASPWHWNHLSSLLLTFWFISTILLLWLWRRPEAGKGSTTAQAPSFNSTALQKACKHHQPQVARDCLLYWGKSQLDHRIHTLTSLADQVTEPLRSELLQLNKALYHPNADDWQGNSLWQAWQNYQPTQPEKPEASQLKPLYS